MTCQSRIRPFPGPTEVACEKDEHPLDNMHEAVLRDYAFPGSETKMSWMRGDRREFEGDWPGFCLTPDDDHGRGPARPCVLPLGHRGRHAP